MYKRQVLGTIKELNRQRGVTVVLITHHMDEAAQADRLVVMTKGRVIADGAPKEIFQDVEGLKAVGLTVPETTQLLWELRQEGLDVPLDLSLIHIYVIPGEEFTIFEPRTLAAFQRCPGLRRDPDLERHNNGITVVVL